MESFGDAGAKNRFKPEVSVIHSRTFRSSERFFDNPDDSESEEEDEYRFPVKTYSTYNVEKRLKESRRRKSIDDPEEDARRQERFQHLILLKTAPTDDDRGESQEMDMEYWMEELSLRSNSRRKDKAPLRGGLLESNNVPNSTKMKVPGTPRHPHHRRGSIDNGIVRSPTMLTVPDRNGDGEPESMFAINDKSIFDLVQGSISRDRVKESVSLSQFPPIREDYYTVSMKPRTKADGQPQGIIKKNKTGMTNNNVSFDPISSMASVRTKTSTPKNYSKTTKSAKGHQTKRKPSRNNTKK